MHGSFFVLYRTASGMIRLCNALQGPGLSMLLYELQHQFLYIFLCKGIFAVSGPFQQVIIGFGSGAEKLFIQVHAGSVINHIIAITMKEQERRGAFPHVGHRIDLFQ